MLTPDGQKLQGDMIMMIGISNILITQEEEVGLDSGRKKGKSNEETFVYFVEICIFRDLVN